MRISEWSSDVCSSDLAAARHAGLQGVGSMRVGALVAREPASRYTPIGVHGQPVSDAHVTLRAALLQRFGPAHAACFARPDRDPRDETIGWIADVPGEADRKSTRLNSSH